MTSAEDPLIIDTLSAVAAGMGYAGTEEQKNLRTWLRSAYKAGQEDERKSITEEWGTTEKPAPGSSTLTISISGDDPIQAAELLKSVLSLGKANEP